jgi:hypothetical protein
VKVIQARRLKVNFHTFRHCQPIRSPLLPLHRVYVLIKFAATLIWLFRSLDSHICQSALLIIKFVPSREEFSELFFLCSPAFSVFLVLLLLLVLLPKVFSA